MVGCQRIPLEELAACSCCFQNSCWKDPSGWLSRICSWFSCAIDTRSLWSSLLTSTPFTFVVSTSCFSRYASCDLVACTAAFMLCIRWTFWLSLKYRKFTWLLGFSGCAFDRRLFCLYCKAYSVSLYTSHTEQDPWWRGTRMRQFTCLTVGTGVLSRIATTEPVKCNEIGYTIVSSSPTFLLYDITINLTSISMYLCDRWISHAGDCID